MNRAKKLTTAPVAQEQSLAWLAGSVVVFGMAQFLAAFWPGVATWGFDHWSEIPLWGRSVILLLLAIVVLPGAAERLARLPERIASFRYGSWIVAGIAFVVFLLFRSKGYAYGDGYSFRSYLEGGQMPELFGNLVFMSGDLAVHWLVYRLVVMPSGGSVELTYALLSALAGVASLAAISAVGRRLYPKSRGARWALLAAGFSSGLAVLWFGHVEAYALVVTALLWSLYLFIAGRLGWGVVLWLIASALHLLAIAFAPVVAWAIWRKRNGSAIAPAKALGLFFAGFLGWGAATVIVLRFKPGIFVPLVSNADTTYTAFSLAHLLDVLNLLLFAAPLGLAGVLVWLVRGRPSLTEVEKSAAGFLAVAGASMWYFAFWTDPLLGAFRDWDLLGLYGIPLSLLGIVLVLRCSPRAGGSQPQWVMAAALAVAHTGVFVLSLQNETKAMERVDRMVREDVHYTREFHKGGRLMSWSHILTHVLDEKARALGYLRLRSQWAPEDKNSWSNLGSVYWHLNQYDSAAASYEKTLAIDSSDARTAEMLMFAYSAAERWPETRRTVERLARLRELRPVELNAWAFSLIALGQSEQADSLLKVSLTRLPEQSEAHYYLGYTAENRGDTSEAISHYEKAMDLRAEQEDVFLRATRLYQARRQWRDSERVAMAWLSRFPRSGTAPFFLGAARIATQQYEPARDALELAISLDSTNALTYFYLATAYRNLGELNRAAAAARRAASLDTALALPYLELVYISADQGDRSGAVAATREYLRRSPGDSGMEYLRQFMEP